MDVSIIVPIYNIKQYISECVDSFFSNDWDFSFEVILVDDGSFDGSSEICEWIARRHPNVHCVHQHNMGLSSARNLGLSLAIGDFILFVDGDDYVDGVTLSAMVSVQKKYDADIVVGSYATVGGKLQDEKVVLPGVSEPRRMTLDEIYRFLHDSYSGIFICAWNKLFRKALFDANPFPVGFLAEDAATIPMIYEKSNTTIYIPRITYYYRRRAESIMNDKPPLYWYSLFRVSLSLSEYYYERFYYDYSSLDLWDSFIGLSKHKNWPAEKQNEYGHWKKTFQTLGREKRFLGLPILKRFVLRLFIITSINIYPLLNRLRRSHASQKVL